MYMFRSAIKRVRRVMPTWLGGHRVRWGPVKIWIGARNDDLEVLGELADQLIGREAHSQVVVTRATMPEVLIESGLCTAKEWPRAFDRLVRMIAKYDPPGESQMQYHVNGVEMMVTRRGTDEIVITRLPSTAKSLLEIPSD